jgi:glycosyltransferase involved in cell wall biosynthesis
VSPKVSVIIPTHNYAHFLPDALESAVEQTYRDLEILVIDDASRDNTAEVVEPFLRDARVLYRRIEHSGLSGARNAGIRLSTGSLIALLDADDIWQPDKLERQVALFDGRPQVGVVYSRRELMDPERQPLAYLQPPLFRGRILEPMFLNNFVCASSAVIRRSVIDAVGFFDVTLKMAEDYDMWLRVASRYEFDYVDQPLVRYRVGHTSLSRREEGGTGYTALHIMRRFLDERGGRRQLPPALVRQAFAETYFHIGLLRRKKAPLAAFGCTLRALAYKPTFGRAWRALASLAITDSGRRWGRRMLGRKDGWDSPSIPETRIPAPTSHATP